jgi:hypothetical protein
MFDVLIALLQAFEARAPLHQRRAGTYQADRAFA